MSWYMLSPSLQHRGIKVEGYASMQRPNISLLWAATQKQQNKQTNSKDVKMINNERRNNNKIQGQASGNAKVMNQAEEDEQQLLKLVKNRERVQKSDSYNRIFQNRSRSADRSALRKPQKRQQNMQKKQFSQKMRYLQNRLLPSCKRDSMDMILDHQLCKQIQVQQSRVSKSPTIIRNNRDKLNLGNGYNAFQPARQIKRDLTQQLRQMYEYEQRYQARQQRNNLRLG